MILSAALPIYRARGSAVLFRPALDGLNYGLACPDLGGEIAFQRACRTELGDDWSVFSATTRATAVARWASTVFADSLAASLGFTRQAEMTLIVVRVEPAPDCRPAYTQTFPYPLIPEDARYVEPCGLCSEVAHFLKSGLKWESGGSMIRAATSRL